MTLPCGKTGPQRGLEEEYGPPSIAYRGVGYSVFCAARARGRCADPFTQLVAGRIAGFDRVSGVH